MTHLEALRNFVREVVAQALSSAPRPDVHRQGTVTAVQPGAAADGNALVTLTWETQTFTAPYGAHYSPVVGHQVLFVLVNGTDPQIIQHTIGMPG